MMRLGKRLATIRTKRGISQRELARQANVSHVLISELESGKRRDVRVSTARQLARTLGTSVDYLVGTWDEDNLELSDRGVFTTIK